MLYKHKTIGTSIPLFSLKSEKTKKLRNGTINDGIMFINWLAKTNQNAWQMLPIHETHLDKDSSNHVNSPYKGYGIGIDPRFLSEHNNPKKNELNEFVKDNSYWLSDYSLFCSLRDRFNTDDWTKWDIDIKKYTYDGVNKWQSILKDEIEKYIILQFNLHLEYKKMRENANNQKIKLVGDMQFYLPFNSPFVWKYQKLFAINPDGSLLKVSGIPYKKNAMYGRQIWGHPLYKWNNKEFNKQINSLFAVRLRYLSNLFDMVRIDHANGFFNFGVIDLKNPDKDYMSPGPGISAFKSLVREAQSLGLSVYAEDAGYDLDCLRKAMRDLGIPGVRVLRCAYDNEHNQFLEEHADICNYPADCMAYTSTHDTETLLGNIQNLTIDQKLKLSKRLNIEYSEDNYKMVANLRNAAINSKARYVIIPLQDWFSTTERINIPGTESPNNDSNWGYRMAETIENLPTDLGD